MSSSVTVRAAMDMWFLPGCRRDPLRFAPGRMSPAHPRRVSRRLRPAGSADVPIDTLGGCWCSGVGGQSPRSLCIPATHPRGYLNPPAMLEESVMAQGSRARFIARDVETPIGRALLGADARDGV